MNINDSLFNVTRQPVIRNNEETKFDYIINEDKDSVISIVSKEYVLVENQKIYSILNDYKGLKAQEIKQFGDARFYWTFVMDGETLKLANGEELAPTIRVLNSYDRSMGLQFMSGNFRLICSNGMHVGTIAERFYSRHIGSNLKEEVFDKIHLAIAQSKAVTKTQFKIYSDIKVDSDQIVEVVKAFPQQYTKDIINYMSQNERPANGWDLMNMSTYVLTHNANRDAEATISLENSIMSEINKILKVNKNAFKQSVKTEMEYELYAN